MIIQADRWKSVREFAAVCHLSYKEGKASVAYSNARRSGRRIGLTIISNRGMDTAMDHMSNNTKDVKNFDLATTTTLVCLNFKVPLRR